MKTNKDWFKLLPKEIRKKAEFNCKTLNSLDKKSGTLASALSSSFLWKNTPEGHDFWQKVSRKARLNDYETGSVVTEKEDETHELHELWRTGDGRVLLIDNMEERHAKSAFKLLLKNHYALIVKYENLKKGYNRLKSCGFNLKGDIAVDFNEIAAFIDFEDNTEPYNEDYIWKDESI